jgi:hypothetical protein
MTNNYLNKLKIEKQSLEQVKKEKPITLLEQVKNRKIITPINFILLLFMMQRYNLYLI